MTSSPGRGPDRTTFYAALFVVTLFVTGAGVALNAMAAPPEYWPEVDSECMELEGGGSHEYQVELVTHAADIWSYSLTVTEYDSNDCTGEGTAVPAEAVNESINNVLVGTCELGLHVEHTIPESSYSGQIPHPSGLTGWVFQNVEFQNFTIDMDADYPASGSTGFLIYPDAWWSPSGARSLTLSVKGPACTGAPTPTATAIDVPDNHEYELGYRWTLIGWVGLERIDVADALAGDGGDLFNDVSGIVTSVYSWDVESQSWRAYFPDAVDVPGANDLEVLRYAMGYWIGIDDPDGTTWIIERRYPR